MTDQSAGLPTGGASSGSVAATILSKLRCWAVCGSEGSWSAWSAAAIAAALLTYIYQYEGQWANGLFTAAITAA